MAEEKKKAHFVLVHGAGLGAWSWYKIVDLLQKQGYTVTAIDLAGAGIHPADPNSVSSFEIYNKPLVDFISSLHDSEKVILVGHSLGGVSITCAAEHSPHKVLALVYVCARIVSGITVEDFISKLPPGSVTLNYGNSEENDPTSFSPHKDFIHYLIKDTLSGMSPSEDVVLTSMLFRPIPIAAAAAPKFNITAEGCKSVPKIYIKSLQDKTMPLQNQEEMIRQYPQEEVLCLDSDHTPFFSVPVELCKMLVSIEAKYSLTA